MQYWFAVAGRTFGPYSPAEFDALLRSRQVPVEAWVYPPGGPQWLPVAEAVARHPPGPLAPVSPMAPTAQYQPSRFPTNALAVTSFVLALVSIPLAFILVGFALAVVAVVLAHLALRELRRAQERQEPQGGRGLAIAGLVVGYAMVAFCVLLIIAAAIPGSGPTPAPTGGSDRQVQTDLRNAATAQEVVYADTQEYTQSVGVLRANGFRPESGADFVITADQDSYCISAFRDGGTTLHLDSETGLGEGPCDEQLA